MDRYEEALERARQGMPIDEVFPELKESEDEKIIKIIINCLQHDERLSHRDVDDCITYLERQKEHHYTKRNDLFDKCVENCDSATMKEVSDNVDAILQKEQKPAEWSEEDEKMIDDIIGVLTKMAESEDNILPEILPSVARKYVKRLKSLPTKCPNWKPSEEQMEALKDAFRKDGGNEYRKVINSLYRDLEKLL